MVRQWTIDAFTSRPFRGNPACVVEPLAQWPETGWMQALARENNAGATAFLVAGEKSNRFSMRWFTPQVEVPLCGHATLAAAHALYREAGFDRESLEFETTSGLLTVRRNGGGYAMSFPSQPAKAVSPSPALSRALGQCPSEVWAGPYLVALFETPDSIRAIDPRSGLLRAISLEYGGQGNVGVAAPAAPGAPYDVIDRFFAPGYGISEDSATGSFHCILAPIFAARLRTDRLRFHQACPGRGADLTCTLRGDRVLLSGNAVTVADSLLRVAPGEGYRVP
jgi:PhzF family phenazine biosynthesis protein